MRLRLPDQGRKVREAWEHFRSHASQRHDSLKSTFPETTSLLHTHTHTRSNFLTLQAGALTCALHTALRPDTSTGQQYFRRPVPPNRN